MIDRQVVNGFIVKVLLDGPTRVVTKVERGNVASATSPERAADKGVRPELVFIREDGWSLGAPLEFAAAAQKLWGDQQVAVLDLTTGAASITRQFNE